MARTGGPLTTSVVRKLLNGVTGFGLFVFVVAHLVGNLTLYLGSDAFNAYGRFLEELGHGAAIVLMEIGLVAFFAVHIATGASIWLKKRATRPVGYAVSASAGGPSRKTLSSRSMLLSGVFLLVYVVLHVWHIKIGTTYTTMVHGEPARDLYRRVVEEFNDPAIVAAYVLSMLFLGLHLRHGAWSMLQTLGATNKRLIPVLYGGAAVVAAVLALGFLALPIWVYLFVDPVPASAIGGMP